MPAQAATIPRNGNKTYDLGKNGGNLLPIRRKYGAIGYHTVQKQVSILLKSHNVV